MQDQPVSVESWQYQLEAHQQEILDLSPLRQVMHLLAVPEATSRFLQEQLPRALVAHCPPRLARLHKHLRLAGLFL
jgi:hypothetical protein